MKNNGGWWEAAWEEELDKSFRTAMNNVITGDMVNPIGSSGIHITPSNPYTYKPGTIYIQPKTTTYTSWYQVEPCTFTWGDHHCDLMASDHRIHQCGLSPNYDCQYDEDAPPEERIRFWFDDTEEWSDWEGYEEGEWQ